MRGMDCGGTQVNSPSAARAVVAALTLLAGVLASQGVALAQPGPTPPPVERVELIVAAFEQVGLRAQGGDWQSADAAYNRAVEAADAHRPFLEAEIGAPAEQAFVAIDGLLEDLVVALDREDAPGIEAVVALIRGRLRTLAPGRVAPGPPQQATLTLLAWRQQLDGAMAAGAAGDWIGMRDTATALAADMTRLSGLVVPAAGEQAPQLMERARVFTLRVRAAALDRSLTDGQRAAEVVAETLGSLLDGVRGAAVTRPEPDPRVLMHFRPYLVRADLGEVVDVPIVAEDIPHVGLGAFRIRVRWSGAALELVDTRWEVGDGRSVRGQTPASVVLELPQAPTGPRGDAVVATLVFEVRSSRLVPTDYLPAAELAALENAIEAAREGTRSADIPVAAGRVMDAMLSYEAGAGEPGSLHATFASVGADQVMSLALLRLLDALTLPEATDVILTRASEADAVLTSAIQSHRDALAAEGGIPIVIETLTVTDTRGEPLPTSDNVVGVVDIVGLDVTDLGGTGEAPVIMTGLPPATLTGGDTRGAETPAGSGGAVENDGSEGTDAAAGGDGTPAASDAESVSGVDGSGVDGSGSTSRLPITVLVFIGAAVLVAGAAVALSGGASGQT